MKKSVIAFAVLITALVALIVFNLSNSQTIENLTQEKTSLEQKSADLQKQIDALNSQLEQSQTIQSKQQEDLKIMNNVIAHNEQLRDENNLLKQKLAKLQAQKAPSTSKAKK